MSVILMRGCSGSGKDTWLKKNYPGAVVVSADFYFERLATELGLTYKEVFDPTLLGEAHATCLHEFTEELRRNWMGRADLDFHNQHIGVANTNTTVVECAPYIALAKAYRQDIRVIELDCPIEVCVARNVHGCTEKIILNQFNNLKWSKDHWPKYWPEIETIKE